MVFQLDWRLTWCGSFHTLLNSPADADPFNSSALLPSSVFTVFRPLTFCLEHKASLRKGTVIPPSRAFERLLLGVFVFGKPSRFKLYWSGFLIEAGVQHLDDFPCSPTPLPVSQECERGFDVFFLNSCFLLGVKNFHTGFARFAAGARRVPLPQ